MSLDYLISDLALILIVAAAVTVIFKKLNQPIVLGYIVAGFLISPNFVYLPTVVEAGDIHVWANIGIVFLMFGLGLEFSFKKIASVGGSAFIIAMTVMCSMILIGAGVGSLMGWSKMDCIFLGGMLSMSSTMIIMKAYEEYGLKNQKFAQIVLGTLVIEDIAGIFMLIVLSTISVSRNVSGLSMVSEIGMLLIFLVIWLLLGIYIIPSIFKKIAKLLNDEMILIISVGICFVMVVIANVIGFSSALGAFMAGSILAGTIYSPWIERVITPIKNLFGAIFFVSVGMMIVPSLLIEYIIPILIITVVTILGQMTFSTVGILLSGQSLNTAVRGGFSMVQIGEFSFIVATLGLNLGVISDFLYPIIVCVSVITSFTTPIFIKNSQKAYEFIERILPKKVKLFIRKNTSDNQINDDKDKDWFEYIKKVIYRTALCSVVMFIIYWAGGKFLDPFMIEHIESTGSAKAATGIITISLMVPFVALMHGTNDALFTKLWLKHRANRLPLLTLKALRIFIAACFIALELRRLMHIPFVILVLIAAAFSFMVIKNDYVKGLKINMEMRFISNFSEKTLAKRKKERGLKSGYHWINESLKVAEYKIVNTSGNQIIYDYSRHKAFQVTIIKIIREDKIIILPNVMEPVKEGDILLMMGTDDEIESCKLLLEKENSIVYTDRKDMILKDYIYGQTFYGIPPEEQIICAPIKVGADSVFLRKSIKNSGIREKYKGSIIGIERGNLPIINPDIETVIMQDDLLWILGSKTTADSLIKKDILRD